MNYIIYDFYIYNQNITMVLIKMIHSYQYAAAALQKEAEILLLEHPIFSWAGRATLEAPAGL